MYSVINLATQAVTKTGTATAPKSNQDADDIYANLTRQQYDDFKKDFGAFEDSLISRAQNDQSLVDQAKKDTVKASGLTKGIAERNASRFGIGMTPDMIKARDTNLQRQNTLGGVDAVNNARFAQKDLNDSLIGSLVDIGAGVNSSALGALGSAASTATSRKNAYTQAKSQSESNTYSTIGSLGAAAMLAFAI